jgi:lipoprotein NlpI
MTSLNDGWARRALTQAGFPGRTATVPRNSLRGWLVLGMVALVRICAGAAEPAGGDTLPPAELVTAATAALRSGQPTNALALATTAIAADKRYIGAWVVRGRAYSVLKQPALAIADFTEALNLDASSANIYQARGEEYFRSGLFPESIADFDRVLELVPAQKPHHWQRGISLYYAGRFEDGRKQFELHQTVNAHDVENAVWHFLCVTRIEGVEKARAALIPITGDRRVPMSEVFSLFAGKIQPTEVLKAAMSGAPRARTNQMFYAHLYLGLYHEALGEKDAAREHIFKAAAIPDTDHYMGDVARAHARVLRARPAP